jgi:hypothetical protein
MDYRDLEPLLARERGLRARLQGLSRPARLGLLTALLAAVALAVFALYPRKDLTVFPQARLLGALGGFTVLALLAGWHALRPLYRPPAPGWISVAVLGAGLGALGVWAALPEVPTVGVPDPRSPRWMIHCLVLGAIAGLAIVLLARALDRGGRTGMDMALYGAAFGGLSANVGLVLFCPINEPIHLLLGHAMVPIALIGLCAIGMLAIRRRRATPSPPPPETPSPP